MAEYGASVSLIKNTLSILYSTFCIPTLSKAVAFMATVPDTFAPLIGLVIEAVGGVVSGTAEAAVGVGVGDAVVVGEGVEVGIGAVVGAGIGVGDGAGGT